MTLASEVYGEKRLMNRTVLKSIGMSLFLTTATVFTLNVSNLLITRSYRISPQCSN